MRVLFIEQEYNDPVRFVDLAPPMAFLCLRSYLMRYMPRIDVAFHSMQIDKLRNRRRSTEDILLTHKPDVVLMSAVASGFPSAMRILSVAKNMGCVTVLGGLFPSANSEFVLLNGPHIDFVVRGEGEATLLELLQCLESRRACSIVTGISYLYEGRPVSTSDRPNLDPCLLPKLCYTDLQASDYMDFNTRYYVFGSRGCPYHCSFCCLSKHWGGNRLFPKERVVAEIQDLIAHFSPRKISFGDETLAINKVDFHDLCKSLEERAFPAKFGGKSRLDLMDRETIEGFARAGFDEISIGIESNIEHQLEVLGKRRLFNQINNGLDSMIAVAACCGIQRINLNLILGAPGETKDSLKTKVDFIIDVHRRNDGLHLVPLLSFFTPYHGTAIYDDLERCGALWNLDQNLENYTQLTPVWIAPSLGDKGMESLVNAYNEIAKETRSEQFNPHHEVPQ